HDSIKIKYIKEAAEIDKFTKNINQITEIARSQHIYSMAELRALLQTLKDKGLISQSCTFDLFYKRSLEIGLTEHTIFIGTKDVSKFSFDKEINIYHFAYSLKKNSFFSMSTSLNLQGYSNYRDNFIFISSELTKKNINSTKLTQESIDEAFSKPYRRTHFIGKYMDKNIVYLTPKYTKNYAVTQKTWPMSSINRALVEMIINVQYFRNSLEIIQTFMPLKIKIDTKEVFNIINEFDLIYPYFQCIGYYLEKIGFTKSELLKFKSKVSELKFYTDKNKDKYKFDNYWNMFYI
ncbi:MAG: hypothetical protein K0R94_668, partial [Burkholderiales bacterium]|nr:hypothetical protein [Burkholderiales bacterium]